MSIPHSYVHCRGCDFKGVMQPRSITLQYVLPDGSVVESHRVLVWCTSCENITNAEIRFDAVRIQAEIDSLTGQKGGFFRRLLDGGKEEIGNRKRLHLLQNDLWLAEIRQSEPRCLSCEETTLVPLNFDTSGSSSIVHSCGHKLFKVSEDFDAPRFSFSYKPVTIRLDPEGRRL